TASGGGGCGYGSGWNWGNGLRLRFLFLCSKTGHFNLFRSLRIARFVAIGYKLLIASGLLFRGGYWSGGGLWACCCTFLCDHVYLFFGLTSYVGHNCIVKVIFDGLCSFGLHL